MKVLGIDIGGTSLKAGIVDAHGNISVRSNIFVSELRKGIVIDNIFRWLEPIIDKHSPASVGIGVPGLISKIRKSIKEVENFPEIEGHDFIQRLILKYPEQQFHFANDANAAAFGTYKFCEDVDVDTFGYLTLGTGVGSAVILDGNLYLGGMGNGPELGMLSHDNQLTFDETTGKQGVLNLCNDLHPKYAKITSIKLNELTPEKIFIAANQNDELAIKVFDMLGVKIAQAVAVLTMMFDVSTVYIGGGISPAFKFFQPSMTQYLNKELTHYFSENLVIKEASLGNDAGILGAAALCLQND